MSTTWSHPQTVVSHLKIHRSDRDTLATQQKVAAFLKNVDFTPFGLPPSAIVCIRTFRTQLPSFWATPCNGSGSLQPWEQGVRTALGHVISRAVRPALGSVPATAEAVLFRDRGELLTCLSKDWCDGVLPLRWWWKDLFPRTVLCDVLKAAWHETPEFIPSTLEQLDRTGYVVRVARRMSAQDAHTVRQWLIQTFGLTHLHAAFETLSDSAFGGVGSSGDGNPSPTPPPSSPLQTSVEQNVPPWRRWVSQGITENVAVEHVSFLFIGLMLHRAPTVVRSLQFARAVERWYRHEKHRAAIGADLRRDKRVSSGSADAPDIFSSQIHNRTESQEQEVKPEPEQRFPMYASSSIEVFPMEEGDVCEQRVRPSSGSARRPNLTPQTGFSPEKGVSAQTVSTESYAGGEVSTRFGGLFYLINVGLFLELYGDFTSPLRPGLTLSLWDFMALLGERLLGLDIKTDPLWSLLAQLAGRDEEDFAGTDFESPDSWRIPVQWLKPIPSEGPWRWSWSGGRLRICHSEGFLILDLPAVVEPTLEQVKSEVQSYGVMEKLLRIDSVPLPDHETSLERWLDWIVPYIRVRLVRALGVAPDSAWPSLFFNHEARVLVSDTRLDVIFSLHRHPFEIRFSGLDRDPGWVPAAGRFIAFYFE